MSGYVCYFCNAPIQPSDQSCSHCASPLILCNRYRLLKTLGQGGFGVVYEALDTQQNNRRCAIKRVGFSSLAEKQQLEMEATILHRHGHLFRFVPELYAFWSNQTHTFMVMECIDGTTLDQTPIPWTPDATEHFLRTILGYLTQLHNANTIHRDLKPWNIKYISQSRYVLLDFGIAKYGNGTLTSARGPGTINYAAPEQLQGLPTDQRSDLYSLAATAYYLITTMSPVQTQSQFGGTLPPPVKHMSGMSHHLDDVLLCMLESNPEQRPQNAEEALALLNGQTIGIATRKIDIATTSSPSPAISTTIPIGTPPLPTPASPVSSTTIPVTPVPIPSPSSMPIPAIPPMPASPNAATVPARNVAPARGSKQSPPVRRWGQFLWLFVPLLLLVVVAVWWTNPFASMSQSPQHSAGVGLAITSSPSPTPIPSRTVTTHATINLATQTAQALMDTLAEHWQQYDNAIQQNNWEMAIQTLDRIIGITSTNPQEATYPSPPYDARIPKVADLRAETRLSYGFALQRDGKLDAAQAQYEAVQTEPHVAQAYRDEATASLAVLQEARDYWELVNTAWGNQEWNMALDALYQLHDLAGFGNTARDPQDGLTVEQLIALAQSYLPNDATAPTSMPIPTVTPIPAEPTLAEPTQPVDPTSTPTPAVAETTSTPEPQSTAQTADPTAAMSPTMANTTPSSLPTTPIATGTPPSTRTAIAGTPQATTAASSIPVVTAIIVTPQYTSVVQPMPGMDTPQAYP